MISLLLAASFLLSTDNTSLALVENQGVWDVAHYGARVADVDEAIALSWNPWFGRQANNEAQHAAAYSVAGEVGAAGAGRNPVNKYGGLAVTHADGCITTQLMTEKAGFVDDVDGAKHLVLELKDRVYDFKVTIHFRAFAKCDAIETWVELANNESGAVRLRRMDSFAMDFPLYADEYHLQYLTGIWAAESQLMETSIAKGETAAIGARSGVRDAWTANPSFMLSIGPRATEDSGRVFGGALCWSGMWGASVRRDVCDFVEIRAGSDTSCGDYVLDAGKKIELPKFVFTYSEHGKGQISRNIHRWARDWRLPAGHKLRPVLLNSWEGSHFDFTEPLLHEMMDGTAEMGGELFVLDDGWFGRGKFARDAKNRDRTGLGDWCVNPEQLPNGLIGLSKEAKKRGLGFGFWLEPEMATTNSWIYVEHPDWILQERTRPLACGRGGTQVILDMTNPAVRDNIFRQMDDACRGMDNLTYIKWDSNADFMNLGSTYLAADKQSNLPFDYTIGAYSLLARLRGAYPKVDIQACSSGGGHVDYGFLHHCDEVWCSDDSDGRERVLIQWGDSQFYPACCLGAHVTAVPNKQVKRVTPLKFRFDVAMSGRFGFELLPKEFNETELAFAKECVASYKRIRPTVQQGDLYRLFSPYEHSFASLMYVDEKKVSAVVFFWSLERGCYRDMPPKMMLKGLDPAKKYLVKEINRYPGDNSRIRVDGKVLSGEALMSIGIRIGVVGDYDSAVLELTAQ